MGNQNIIKKKYKEILIETKNLKMFNRNREYLKNLAIRRIKDEGLEILGEIRDDIYSLSAGEPTLNGFWADICSAVLLYFDIN